MSDEYTLLYVKTYNEVDDMTFCFFKGTDYKGKIEKHLVEFHRLGGKVKSEDEARAKLP